MDRNKKRIVTSSLIALLLAGFLGLGNYSVKINSDLIKPSSQAQPIDAGNTTPQPGLQQPESSTAQTQEQERVTCVSVYDGDTITVMLAKSPNKLIKVRLIGLDTPELIAGEFGEAAGNFTRNLLLNQDIHLVYDTERYDKYGRTLAYVYLKDGIFINARLLEQGFARIMSIAPNTAHAAEFEKLQAKAEEKHVGIWAVPPPKCTWRDETVVKEWTF